MFGKGYVKNVIFIFIDIDHLEICTGNAFNIQYMVFDITRYAIHVNDSKQ